MITAVGFGPHHSSRCQLMHGVAGGPISFPGRVVSLTAQARFLKWICFWCYKFLNEVLFLYSKPPLLPDRAVWPAYKPAQWTETGEL